MTLNIHDEIRNAVETAQAQVRLAYIDGRWTVFRAETKDGETTAIALNLSINKHQGQEALRVAQIGYALRLLGLNNVLIANDIGRSHAGPVAKVVRSTRLNNPALFV